MNTRRKNADFSSKWVARTDIVANVALAIAAIGVGIAATGNYFGGPRPTTAGERTDREISDFERLAAEGRRIGPDDAVVTIVEFGDYECPFCRRLEDPLRSVLEAYPDEVALVYRHLPLQNHANAYWAARVSECGANQGMFEQTHRLLFDAIALDRISPAALARTIGIPDTARFIDCMQNADPVQNIERDLAWAENLGIARVPAVIFNGTLLAVPPDSTTLVEMVEMTLR